MKYDIILAGVGGQGVLSIAAIIAVAAVDAGYHIKQAEVHGMSQRGGAVQSDLRIADRPIYSDLVAAGTADMLLAMEPMEALRYFPYMAPDGVIVADRNPVMNISNYPDLDGIYDALREYPRVVLLDAEQTARDLRAFRSANMVLLGAAASFLPLKTQALEQAIEAVFGRKGEKVVAQNVEAFRQGMAIAGMAQV